MRIAFVLTACLLALPALGQKPVYLCGKVYTDQPCKEGREVDITPTRGADSMSGKSRESSEATMERIGGASQKATERGMQEATRLIRCDELRRRREAIDRAGKDAGMGDQRFSIRKEQFKLSGSRT
jgi:hypothetical protein